jgi:hypothetical protein
MIKENAEEDRESWRVVRLSESNEVSVSEDRGFEEIDSRSSRVATLPASVAKQG